MSIELPDNLNMISYVHIITGWPKFDMLYTVLLYDLNMILCPQYYMDDLNILFSAYNIHGCSKYIVCPQKY